MVALIDGRRLEGFSSATGRVEDRVGFLGHPRGGVFPRETGLLLGNYNDFVRYYLDLVSLTIVIGEVINEVTGDSQQNLSPMDGWSFSIRFHFRCSNNEPKTDGKKV